MILDPSKKIKNKQISSVRINKLLLPNNLLLRQLLYGVTDSYNIIFTNIYLNFFVTLSTKFYILSNILPTCSLIYGNLFHLHD